MIVCVCNNISDREIRQAADLGLNTMSALRDDLGVGTCCGKCKSCAKTVLKEYRNAGAGQAPAMTAKSVAFPRRTQAA
ncbi:bacterioferritin-associated ferredoxin [Herminiimonas sp. CN]|uniref:(2Fe-2S)-binding protein n=1 Tax=Herminiimonas sp. CN TaxID=1349818 RepID=UPI00047402BC|nr:(2Fe-2S)-binding protein [Herminiimonas sp. CN]